MTGRARNRLHLVEDGDAQAAKPNTPVLPDVPGRPLLSLRQQSVVLAIGGRLNADTAGRLRMFLSMFTVAGGPQELVLDLSDVFAVDEDGMAPVFEAEEAMRPRMACLRLASESASVCRLPRRRPLQPDAHHLSAAGTGRGAGGPTPGRRPSAPRSGMT
jgi:anti-anti-sigma regulatory factor